MGKQTQPLPGQNGRVNIQTTVEKRAEKQPNTSNFTSDSKGSAYISQVINYKEKRSTRVCFVRIKKCTFELGSLSDRGEIEKELVLNSIWVTVLGRQLRVTHTG